MDKVCFVCSCGEEIGMKEIVIEGIYDTCYICSDCIKDLQKGDD